MNVEEIFISRFFLSCLKTTFLNSYFTFRRLSLSFSFFLLFFFFFLLFGIKGNFFSDPYDDYQVVSVVGLYDDEKKRNVNGIVNGNGAKKRK